MVSLKTSLNIVSKHDEIRNIGEKYDISVESVCAFLNNFITSAKYSNTNLREDFKTNMVINELLSFARQMSANNENIYNAENSYIRTKTLIESTCFELNSIAKTNSNRFVFMNIDMTLKCNKSALSRIILNICCYMLSVAENHSALKIISYAENNEFTIEFVFYHKKDYKLPNIFESIKSLLLKIKGEFFCENISQTETAFKIIMPYENTRF